MRSGEYEQDSSWALYQEWLQETKKVRYYHLLLYVDLSLRHHENVWPEGGIELPWSGRSGMLHRICPAVERTSTKRKRG